MSFSVLSFSFIEFIVGDVSALHLHWLGFMVFVRGLEAMLDDERSSGKVEGWRRKWKGKIGIHNKYLKTMFPSSNLTVSKPIPF